MNVRHAPTARDPLLRAPAQRAPSSATENPPTVILGGGGTGLSVARSLTNAGVKVVVLDRSNSPSRYSRLRASFVELDADEMQASMLDWLRTGMRGAVVLACGDEGLELIARNRSELLDLGYRPMEADDDVLLAMLDKSQTHDFARAHGIPVPRVMRLNSNTDLDTLSSQLSYPCVLKPVHSHVFVRRLGYAAKVLIARDRAELEAQLRRMAELGVEMLAIEVVRGPDEGHVSYYSYLDEDGEPLFHFTKRKLRQYPPAFGFGTYHVTTADPEVAELGLRFFQSVGLRGLGNVEFKRDERDGQLKLIECNARFTASNEVIRRAGVDLALFSYLRLIGRPTPVIERYRVGMRQWDPINDTRAFVAYRRRGELSFGRWAASLAHRQAFPLARIDDPLPATARVSRIAVGAVTQGRRRLVGDGAPLELALGGLAQRLTNAGPRGPAIAARIDMVRSTGVGYVRRRVVARRREGTLGEEVRHEVYERIWREAAEANGAGIEKLAAGVFELTRDGLAARVSHQMTDRDDPVTLRVALDKALTHRLLAAAEVTIPDHVEFALNDPGPALDFLARAGGPCVVKPAAGTGGGHGTTAGIERPAELMRARIHAAQSGGRLMIEKQAEGAVYRLLFLDGRLLDVLRSRPSRVTGDGRSTVEQLIAAENHRRIAARGDAGISLIGATLDLVLTLERAGLKLSSVLPSGQTVAVRTVTNGNCASDNETVDPGEVSPHLIAEAKRAAAAVGVRLAGVDIITPDLARPLSETGGVVTEVNGTPALHHHYLVADPQGATRVAIPVLDWLLSDPTARAQPRFESGRRFERASILESTSPASAGRFPSKASRSPSSASLPSTS
jgi:D-aspartate ligase